MIVLKIQKAILNLNALLQNAVLQKRHSDFYLSLVWMDIFRFLFRYEKLFYDWIFVLETVFRLCY